MNRPTEVIIIGGGAAGFFAAINMAESNPDLKVSILEKSSKVLQKVKISGGGRCNVTHACFDPKELTSFYPRGHKELLGPFHTFMTGDTVEWFERRGIPLKTEEDMRMFPESNSSQTIIDCFLSGALKAGVNVMLNQQVISMEKDGDAFLISTKSNRFRADKLLISTGSNSKIWGLLRSLGHHIVEPVPSLFTFNINNDMLKGIPGISVPDALVSVDGGKYQSSGPLLITHWGISGPAVLKLSSLAAIELARLEYHFSVTINWLNRSFQEVFDHLMLQKKEATKKNILMRSPYGSLAKRLWANIVGSSGVSPDKNWSDLSNRELETLAHKLTETRLLSNGKTTFKEEFVTAGGLDLKEVNFKRFESKLHSNLFFAGEVLNIDGLTGGFNFQNAWTGAYIAAKAIAGA